MNSILATSAVCAGVSLLGLLGLSAMTFAPGGEARRSGMMSVVGFCLVGWVALAVWARRRSRLSPDKALAAGAKTVVVICGVIYVLVVLLCAVG